MSDFWNADHNLEFNNEADVETRLVIPLLRALGYSNEDLCSKYPVVFQQGRRGRKPEADLVVFSGPLKSINTSLIVVETKTPGEAFDGAKSQGESYAFNVRAPFLLITDGRNLELWQLNVSMESVCVLQIPTDHLASARGQLEATIGKMAAIAYCQSLPSKNIITYAKDFDLYLSAELTRASKQKFAIARTLSLDGGNSSENYPSNTLLTNFPNGAIIVGQSGFGKTTLSTSLFTEAISGYLSGENELLPFELPLPDLAQTGLTILDFIYQRLSAHLPGTTKASLSDLLRTKGATLFCDSFDRLSREEQNHTETSLRILSRDFPKIQTFVFSRRSSRPNLALPSLSLNLLTNDEQNEWIELAEDRNQLWPAVSHMLPQILRELCKHPLLLNLTLSYWKRENQLPLRINELFRDWLEAFILPGERNAATSINRESALRLLAKETTNTPINKVKALSLLRENDFTDSTFDELVRSDAIHIKGQTVELQHEALADYLRALDVLSRDNDQIQGIISGAPLDADSFFPILLMAMLPTRSLQRGLWQRLANSDILLYCNSLRYRADLSDEMAISDQDDLSFNYLQDFLDGLKLPLAGCFPQVADIVTEQVTGNTSDEIAVTGAVTLSPREAVYALHGKKECSGNEVTVGQPARDRAGYYINLERSQLRLDSGRLLGTMHLKDRLLQAVDERTIKGGTALASERLMGRLRYLAKEYSFPVNESDSLEDIQNQLMPHADKIMFPSSFKAAPSFTIKSLLQDIEVLHSVGVKELDPWWVRLGWDKDYGSMGESVIQNLLDEHFRRVQLVYAEIVENTFNTVAQEFGFYAALPVRWDLAIVNSSRGEFLLPIMHHQWHPVAAWDEAGADIEFTETRPDRFSLGDFSEIDKELSQLGRPSDKGFSWGGWQPMLKFDGNDFLGNFNGETTVLNEACSIISNDIKRIFSELPTSD